MAEVEKGETTTAVTFQSKRPTAILIVSAVLMAAFLGGALAVCFVAATTATSVSSSDAMDEESLAEYFGGLEVCLHAFVCSQVTCEVCYCNQSVIPPSIMGCCIPVAILLAISTWYNDIINPYII
jgi:hypothetical protein